MGSFENSTVVTTAATNNKKTYEQGLEEAWDIARKIAVLEAYEGGYSISDVNEIFGKNIPEYDDILRNMSIHDVKAKVDAWEAEKTKPKLGDVVEVINLNSGWSTAGIYYSTDDTHFWILIPGKKIPQILLKENWKLKKIGKHFDIQGMFDEIKEVVF